MLLTDAHFTFQFVVVAYIDVLLQFGYDIIDVMYTINFNFRYSYFFTIKLCVYIGNEMLSLCAGCLLTVD